MNRRLEAWQLGIRVLHSLENSLDVACKKINKMTLGRLLLQNLRQCVRCVRFCYLTASEPSLSFTVGVGLAGLYFPVGVCLSFDAVTHKHRQHRRSTVTLEGALWQLIVHPNPTQVWVSFTRRESLKLFCTSWLTHSLLSQSDRSFNVHHWLFCCHRQTRGRTKTTPGWTGKQVQHLEATRNKSLARMNRSWIFVSFAMLCLTSLRFRINARSINPTSLRQCERCCDGLALLTESTLNLFNAALCKQQGCATRPISDEFTLRSNKELSEGEILKNPIAGRESLSSEIGHDFRFIGFSGFFSTSGNVYKCMSSGKVRAISKLAIVSDQSEKKWRQCVTCCDNFVLPRSTSQMTIPRTDCKVDVTKAFLSAFSMSCIGNLQGSRLLPSQRQAQRTSGMPLSDEHIHYRAWEQGRKPRAL